MLLDQVHKLAQAMHKNLYSSCSNAILRLYDELDYLADRLTKIRQIRTIDVARCYAITDTKIISLSVRIKMLHQFE